MHPANRLWRIPLFVVFTLLLVLVIAVGGGSAQQPDPTAPGKSGLAAVEALGNDLAAVADEYGTSAAELQDALLRDPDLYLDSSNKLVYVCRFDLPPGGDLPAAAESAPAEAPYPSSETFLLHSLPGAPLKIYLDFDGHTTSGTIWNSNHNGGLDINSGPYDIDGNPASFSATELDRIQYIWQRVAEDFIFFDVDVTTEDPGVDALIKSGSGDAYYGQRVVVSPYSSWYGSAGGVAYIGTFSWNTDTPTFVFSDNLGNGHEKYTAEAASHETGHTLGLYHDGKTDGTAYYRGHGDWAPIMGVGYYEPIVQWSKGEYDLANNHEDDLVIMQNYGPTYRADDHGDAAGAATTLFGPNLAGGGLVEQRDDKDVFSFQTGAGAITINVDPGPREPNLDVQVELRDANYNQLALSDPYGLPASLNWTATAGTYYIVVDGVGTGDPSTGYSDYASLGQYFISGTIIDAGVNQPPTAVASATPESGVAPLAVSFSSAGSSDPEGGSLTYYWDFGDGSNSTLANPNHSYAAEGSYTANLTVTDDEAASDVASVVVTVTPPPPAGPSGLAATPVPYGQIDLAWNDNAANEDGFRLERMPDGGSWSVLAMLGADVTAYSDSGLPDSALYHYRVLAFNVSGDSDPSNTASATTPDPPPFEYLISSGEIAGGGTFSGSYLNTQGDDTAVQVLTERESGGKPANRHSYLVHTWTFEVQSGQALTFFANAWAPANAEGDRFTFSWSTDGNSFGPMFDATEAGADPDVYESFMLPSNLSGTLYVRVTDSDQGQGNRSLDSVTVDHLYVLRQVAPGDPPAAPSDLNASNVTSSGVVLAWTDNADDELGFRVERSSNGSDWGEVGNTGANETTFSDSGLAANTAYHYRVLAYNSSGLSDPSAAIQVTTDPPAGMYVSDMVANATVSRNKWNAQVTIHVVSGGSAVGGATVSGAWSGGSTGAAECTTNAEGWCTVTKNSLKSTVSSVTFTVSDVTAAGLTYDAGHVDNVESVDVTKP